jgi:2,5-furandicarboxylate decarboxylase 1
MTTDLFRLKTFIDGLDAADVLRVQVPTDLADVAKVVDGTPKAVLFEATGLERSKLAANVAGSRARLAKAFATPQMKLLRTVLDRLATPQQVIEVERREAPVQQVVEIGPDVNLFALPIHLQHSLDGGLFISSAMDVSIDESSGWSNLGIRRLMLHSPNETGIGLFSPSDLKAIYERSAAQQRHLPIAFVVGSHPIDHVAATMRIPGDELRLLASLRGQPLNLVKCITNDILVPADAEYVLEGYLDAAGHKYPEGPFGEFLGYYGGVKLNPRFRVTAITHRHDAVFQTSTIAGANMANTDTAQLNSLRTETVLWTALQSSVRGVLAVHATAASGGMFNVRIALRQFAQGEARNVIATAFGCSVNVKHVFVVDDDIDIFSNDQMDWALATRFQADRDLVIQAGLRAIPLDPSLNGAGTGAKAGFDLTKSGQHRGLVESVVPKTPTFDHPRFSSIVDALSDGDKTFEQLMGAIGSRDGREVVAELFELQQKGRAVLADNGKWRYT